MLANYEVEMLTGNGGEWGKIAASDVIKRKEEEVVEWEKMAVKESWLRVSVLIGELCFCFWTLSLLHENITFGGSGNKKESRIFSPPCCFEYC